MTILVKAVPRASKKYGETVCCAGVTEAGIWKRLYPVRFRQLTDDNRFRRWDWLKFRYRRPPGDARPESCHLFEDTIEIAGQFEPNRRAEFLDRLVVGSALAAAAHGQSLALIRPKNTRFVFKKKSEAAVESERQLFVRAGRQKSFLDAELEAFSPLPYAFAFRFEDAEGKHMYQCGDWETQATFWKWSSIYGESRALELLSGRYNEEYPRRGMVFAIGTVLKRPHIWQLLGVLRGDVVFQQSLNL